MTTNMEVYDEDYFEHGMDSRKNSMSGAYTWDRLGGYFSDTAKYISQHYAPERTCDFGCAKGMLVSALCDSGVDAYGIDFSDYAVKNSHINTNGRIFRHDLTTPLPCKKMQTVDLLTCFDVLEHIEEEHIPMVFENMLRLMPRNIVMNICVLPEKGYDKSHVTVKPRVYWINMLYRYLPGYRLRHSDCSDVWWFNNPETLFSLEVV